MWICFRRAFMWKPFVYYHGNNRFFKAFRDRFSLFATDLPPLVIWNGEKWIFVCHQWIQINKVCQKGQKKFQKIPSLMARKKLLQISRRNTKKVNAEGET